MFVYNITSKVNNSIAEDWLKWQKEEHIPEIIATNLFQDYKIYHLPELEDAESRTYTIQFFAIERSNYDSYIKNFAPGLKAEAFNKWGDQFISFRSLMEHVQ